MHTNLIKAIKQHDKTAVVTVNELGTKLIIVTEDGKSTINATKTSVMRWLGY